jgi:hypothetical protein
MGSNWDLMGIWTWKNTMLVGIYNYIIVLVYRIYQGYMGYSRDSHLTFRIFVAWCSALLVGIVNSGNIDFRNLGV